MSFFKPNRHRYPAGMPVVFSQHNRICIEKTDGMTTTDNKKTAENRNLLFGAKQYAA